MFDIITREHPEVKKHSYNYPASITFTAERTYFSVKLKALTGYKHEDRLIFVADVDRLYFTKTDTHTGAWILKVNKLDAMEINGRSLVAFLQEKFRFLKFQAYPVKLAKAELGSYPLWEVLLDKSLPMQRAKKKKTKQ